MKIALLRGFLLLNGLFLAALSNARESAFPLHLTLGGEAVLDTNANRSPIESEELEELQLSTFLSLFGAYEEHEKFRADVDYRWSRTEYQEDSQQEDSTLRGQAALNFGGASDFYALRLSHDSSVLLVDPVGDDVQANREDRNTLTAALTLRTLPQRPNQFSLTASQSNVYFDENELNDTESKTVQLSYTRLMTALNTGGFSLSLTDVKYPNFPSGEYDNTLIYAYFQRQLRALDYYLALGMNKTSTAIEDSHSPYALFSLGYVSGRGQFDVSASRQVTDNSRGASAGRNFVTQDLQALEEELEQGAIVDGSLASRDQIDRTTFRLGYSAQVLCARCNTSVSLTQRDDEFFNTPSLNSEDLDAIIGIGYRATRQSTINLSIRHLAFSFTEQDNPNNYTQNSVRLAWFWSSAVTGLRFGTFVSALERNFDEGGSYSGFEYGASLSYQLF